MIEAVIEQAVSHLLSTAVDKWKKSRVLDFPNFDFVYERDDGEKVAFEILGTDPNEYKLASISNLLNKEENVDQVYVVTQDSPTKIQLALFDGIVSPKKIPVKWIGLNELPGTINVTAPKKLNTPAGVAALQLAALTANTAAYRNAPIGAESYNRILCMALK